MPRLDGAAGAGSYANSAPDADEASGSVAASVAVPLRLRSPFGTLSFIGTTMVFGTAVDITLSEVVLETFFPADAATAQALAQLAQASG